MPQIDRLLGIMDRLRDPDGGCPWDLEQTPETIAPYTIEEAYEVEDAIRSGDPAAFCEELGDLLLQVVFHARMAAERGWFDFADVARTLSDKLVRRHPNVFAGAEVDGAAGQVRAWEASKAAERAAKAAEGGRVAGALDDVPLALPALMRAEKLVRRARRAGFRWADPAASLGKLSEELGEVREAIASGDADAMAAECGDLFFAGVSVCGEIAVDPEAALRSANARFEGRFRHVESALAADGRSMHDASPGELAALWRAAKAAAVD